MADKTEHEAQRDDQNAENSRHLGTGVGHFGVVPPGYNLESLEQFQVRPNRVRQKVSFVDIASFSAYVNKYADADSLIRANVKGRTMEAVIDYHSPSEPKFGDHVATFNATFDPLTEAWLNIGRSWITQAQFAEFLEEYAHTVVDPDSAAVMEMVMRFEATKKVSFKSGIRLNNGARELTFVEDVQTGAGRGAIRFPERFTVRAPIFQGTVIVDTPYLIRYRIGDDGKLAFMVQMHQKDVRLRESFQAHCVDAFSRDSKLELPVYYVG